MNSCLAKNAFVSFEGCASGFTNLDELPGTMLHSELYGGA